MVGAETAVATYINEIMSHVHLTHCHGYPLQLAVGETIKAVKIMRDTLGETYQILIWLKNHRKKIKYSLKREVASNRLRQDTAPGNSNDRPLCSNCWTVKGALLQTILDN